MPNPNPKTGQLALGRGKRPKLNHQPVSMRMSSQVKQRLEEIAGAYDCFYGGKPQVSKLLEKIASGELLIVPAPPTHGVKEAVRTHLKEKHYRKSSDLSQASSGGDVDDPKHHSLS